MEMPDLNDVRIFVAVGHAGTLTAAAQQLSFSDVNRQPGADSP